MRRRRPPKFYLKAELFFPSEPDWELLATGLRRFRGTVSGRIEFQHAQLQNNDYVLPFYFETHLETHKFEDRQRIDLDPEEAKEELYIELRENVEGFFGCHVEFTELIPDYLHPEDLRELEEAFTRKEHDFFAPRHSVNAEDLQPEKDSKTISDPFAELDRLIGLESVKQQIHDLAELVQKYGRENLPCLHMVFRGNPGTGKTTVARIIAQIFDDAGITSGKGTFVETDREGLVGMYVGHTAVKTKRVIKKAKGGTLFIDEAYALAAYEGGRDFGEEAIATLVTVMNSSVSWRATLLKWIGSSLQTLVYKIASAFTSTSLTITPLNSAMYLHCSPVRTILRFRKQLPKKSVALWSALLRRRVRISPMRVWYARSSSGCAWIIC